MQKSPQDNFLYPHLNKSKIVYKNFANKNPKKETKQIVDFWGFFVYIVIIRRVLFPCRLYIGRSPF